MYNVGDAMTELIAKMFETRGECPDCSSPLFAWKNKRADGKDRCAPVCMDCGYKQIRIKEQEFAKNNYQESKQSKMKDYFRNGSILTNKTAFDCTFQTFRQDCLETRESFELVNEYCRSVLNGNPNHLILTGNTGTGKTHLAMAACNEILKKSAYTKKVLFINYRELLEQLKFAMSDQQIFKKINGNLMKEIKIADLVVIDDIGAELGGASAKESTRYNSDVLYGITEAREDKATIYTTNLNSKGIKDNYGSRILSRIMNNTNGFVFSFVNAKDRRVVGF